MSRFNVLYRGEPDQAAELLEDSKATNDDLRAALTNALRRVAQLERRIDQLHSNPSRRRKRQSNPTRSEYKALYAGQKTARKFTAQSDAAALKYAQGLGKKKLGSGRQLLVLERIGKAATPKKKTR